MDITANTQYDETPCPTDSRAATTYGDDPYFFMDQIGKGVAGPRISSIQIDIPRAGFPAPIYRGDTNFFMHLIGKGMAVPNVSLMLVSLKLEDNPVGYAPPIGPAVRFIATYNQYESGQPANFNFSNLGQKWTFNWLAYLTDNPASPSDDVSYYVEGGGSLTFTGFNSVSQSFAPEVKSQTILTRTAVNSYSLLFPDGSQHIFSQPTATTGTSRNVFLTQVIDPQGNSVQISYDDQFRIIALTDAIGQVTVFSYTDASDPLKVTKVTDPFGRFATFQYNTNGLLAQITDGIGLTSQFTYDAGTGIGP